METTIEKHTRNAADANSAELIQKAELPVLMYFWAPWCRACLAMATVVDTLADRYAGSVRVIRCNVDECSVWSRRCEIQSIPTLILFDGGKPLRKIIGSVPADRICSEVDVALAASASDRRPAVTAF